MSEPAVSVRRRTLLRAAGAGALATAAAGCSTQTRRYEAAPVELASGADQQGYTLESSGSSTVEREEEVGGTTLQVTLVNRYASYDHEGGSFVESASVGLGSTPKAEEGGVALNPVMRQSPRELLTSDIGAEFLQQFDLSSDWQRGPEEVATGEGTLFGEQVVFQTFAGVTDDGEFALLNVVKVDQEGDVVLVGDSRTKDAGSDGDRPFVGEDGHVTRATVDEAAGMFADLLPLVVHGGDVGTSTTGTSAGDTAPVFEVAQRGVSLEAGEALLERLGSPFVVDPDLFGVSEVGTLQYVDPERYRTPPTRSMEPMEVSDEDGPDRTVERTLDVDRLAELPEPPNADEAGEQLLEALGEVGLHPDDLGFPGSTRVETRNSEGALLDTDANVIARSKLDTVVELYPTLDGIPLEGPGAKIRATLANRPEFDRPVLTDLRHAFYGVREAGEVELVDPETAEERYRARMEFGEETELSTETRLTYYAPALDRPDGDGGPASEIRPYYQVRAEVQGEEGSFRPFPMRFPAWTEEAVSGSFRPGSLDLTGISPPDATGSAGLREPARLELQSSRSGTRGRAYRGEYAVESNIFRNMGQNLRSGLRGRGVSQDAYEERFDVDENDFESPGDDNQIDAGDLTFEVVHGSSGALWFEKQGSGGNVYQDRWGHNRADGDWGDYDLEWLVMFNCDTLYPGEGWGCPQQAGWNGPDPLGDRWGDNMDGAHLLLGFRTYGFPGPWQSQALVRYLYRGTLQSWYRTMSIGTGLTVARAWHLMLDNYQQNISSGTRKLLNKRCLPIGRSTVVAAATRRNGGWYTPIDDRVWGEGTVGRDIPQSDVDGYYIQLG